MNTLKIGVVCTMLITVAMSALALDYATATGADILNEHASLKTGFNEWQLIKLGEKIQGRILTFENGCVEEVQWNEEGLKIEIDFPRPFQEAVMRQRDLLKWAFEQDIDCTD